MSGNKIFQFACSFILLFSSAFAKENKKIIICGVCKNIEASIPVTTASIDALKERFEDYRIVIYENNSKDKTKDLLKSWSAKDPKILIISETVSHKKMRSMTKTHTCHRTEIIARARNIVLNEIMKSVYDDFSYVIMADLDMDPWDVQGIVDTINNTTYEWDAVCANGSYDLYAFRNEEYPLGAELLGKKYWSHVSEIDLRLSKEGDWKRVYSAFGGLAVYKRDAMKGCRYEGVVTPELEAIMARWIEEGLKKDVFLAKEYKELKETLPIIEIKGAYLKEREKFSEEIGMKLQMPGCKVIWFGSDENTGLPVTCEHVYFHAMMIQNGRNKIYINPNMKSGHP